MTITLRDGVRREEVGYRTTSRADVSTYNTEHDASDLVEGHFRVDERNFPWALHVPDVFIYPKDTVSIEKVYFDFASWATYGGASNDGRYRAGPGVEPLNAY